MLQVYLEIIFLYVFETFMGRIQLLIFNWLDFAFLDPSTFKNCQLLVQDNHETI